MENPTKNSTRISFLLEGFLETGSIPKCNRIKRRTVFESSLHERSLDTQVNNDPIIRQSRVGQADARGPIRPPISKHELHIRARSHDQTESAGLGVGSRERVVQGQTTSQDPSLRGRASTGSRDLETAAKKLLREPGDRQGLQRSENSRRSERRKTRNIREITFYF